MFIIAKRWKQSKCPPFDEWIDKMWYIHTMEYYSAKSNNEVLRHVTAWINLENIIGERSQSQKKPHIVWFLYMKCPE